MEWNTTNDICGIEFDPFRVGIIIDWCSVGVADGYYLSRFQREDTDSSRPPWALAPATDFHAFSVRAFIWVYFRRRFPAGVGEGVGEGVAKTSGWIVSR